MIVSIDYIDLLKPCNLMEASLSLIHTHTANEPMTRQFSKEDHAFIDFLFGKLTTLTDTEMIDLQDDDSCDDHLQFEQLYLF